MKRSLLLLSVLSVSAAHAQSTVSLAGTVDLAVNGVRGSLTSRTQLVSGGNSTSKLVFRATEDLGGGLYAFSWLEAGLLADTGEGQATSTNNQPSGVTQPGGLTFNRRSIVGLGGTWGEVHAGRDWAPNYDAFTSRYDVFGVGVGIGLNYTSSVNPLLVRVSNDVGYTTPKFFGGLSVNVQHWAGENASGTPLLDYTSSDGTGSGVRLNFDNGPWSAVAHYMKTTYRVGGDITLRGGAGYYDPGAWKVSFNFNDDEQGRLHQRGWNVGGLVRVGAGEIKMSYSGLETLDTIGDPKGTKIAIGYVHNLSKRTALYATYAHISNSGGSKLAIAGSTTAPNRSSSGYDLGLRHFF